jgi:hypothetical protein
MGSALPATAAAGLLAFAASLICTSTVAAAIITKQEGSICRVLGALLVDELLFSHNRLWILAG